jgi:hypothetical protein
MEVGGIVLAEWMEERKTKIFQEFLGTSGVDTQIKKFYLLLLFSTERFNRPITHRVAFSQV